MERGLVFLEHSQICQDRKRGWHESFNVSTERTIMKLSNSSRSYATPSTILHRFGLLSLSHCNLCLPKHICCAPPKTKNEVALLFWRSGMIFMPSLDSNCLNIQFLSIFLVSHMFRIRLVAYISISASSSDIPIFPAKATD
jgi:hypothetical protein